MAGPESPKIPLSHRSPHQSPLSFTHVFTQTSFGHAVEKPTARPSIQSKFHLCDATEHKVSRETTHVFMLVRVHLSIYPSNPKWATNPPCNPGHGLSVFLCLALNVCAETKDSLTAHPKPAGRRHQFFHLTMGRGKINREWHGLFSTSNSSSGPSICPLFIGAPSAPTIIQELSAGGEQIGGGRFLSEGPKRMNICVTALLL